MSAPKTKPAAKSTKSRAPASRAAPRKAANKASPKVSAKPVGRVSDAAMLKKVSELCLALPDTKLTMTWGSPHFRVGEKIFCGFGAEEDKQVMGVKLALSHAQRVVKEARFWPAKYVGKHGWVSFDVARRKSWDEVGALIRESYELIAPKASREKLR